MGIRVALATICAVVALGSACGSDDPAASPLPSTASLPPSSPTLTGTPIPATPTSTPAPTPPSQPALARQDSPAGAEAFARFWLSTLDYAYQTGDTKPFSALATGECKTCAGLAGGIEDYYAQGGRVEGGAVRLRASEVVRHVPQAAALVGLRYTRDSSRLVPTSGSPTPVPAEREAQLLLTLRREPESWTVTLAQSVRRR